MRTAASLQNLAAKPRPLSTSTHAGLLLQRKCACGSPTTSLTGECAECKSNKRLQTKLTVGASNDPLEQEADRVADQVLAAPVNLAASGTPPRIQRFTRQATEGTDTAPASVDRVLASSGKPLDPALRQDMEQRFGHDFSRVRVHSGATAEQSAREVNASAYAVGHKLVFGAGRYEPGTHEGRKLIAHELTHVVQQAGAEPVVAGVGRTSSAGPPRQTRLFRKPGDKAHYPTVEEQEEIKKLLGRDAKTTRVVTTASGEQVEETGRPLTVDQIKELAARLEQPLADELDKQDTGSTGKGSPLTEGGAREAVVDARQAVTDRFGKYTTKKALVTFNAKISEQDRKKAGQVLVVLGDPEAATAFAHTLLGGCKRCQAELKDLDNASRSAVTGFMRAILKQKHGEQLERVAKYRVPGKHGDEGKITLRVTERAAFYPTAVHEFIHQLTHPAFHAAFLGKHRNIVEGFTEYFTYQIVGKDPKIRGLYVTFAEAVDAVRAAIKGPFASVGTGGSAEESLRQAYFQGRLDLIGWTATDEKERKAVADTLETEEEKRRPLEWSAETAKKKKKEYVREAQEQQAPSRNVLSVGLFFAKKSPDTIAVRYARVIWRDKPFAKNQVFLEGQVLSAPIRDPKVLGLSFGGGYEYQEPRFYASAGVRFVGTNLPGTGTNQLDVSPFIGVGIRPWQTVRVGAEGFALIPTEEGRDRAYGVGATVGVEF